jgi:hypothetical protein
MTLSSTLGDDIDVSLTSAGGDVTAKSVDAYPMKSVWTTQDAVRKAPRVYSYKK